MTAPTNPAGVMFCVIFSFIFFIATPSNAQSSWDRCDNNADWYNRISACQTVIGNGDSAKRLAVAHFYVAVNLDLSYDQHHRAKTSEIDKILGVTPDVMCDPLLIIYSPNPGEAQRQCNEFKALLGVGQPKIGEPTTTDINRVLREYNTALKYDPAHIEARRKRGVILRRMDRYREAIADFDVVLNARPTHAQARYLRGDSYYKAGDYAAAIPDFNAAVAGDAYTPAQKLSIRVQRAYAHLATKNHKAAISDYSAVINAGGAKSDSYAKRGQAYLSTGKFAQAEADFTQALGLTPPKQELHSLYWARGGVRMQLKNQAGAIDDFSSALKIKEAAQLYSVRGHGQFELGKFAEAKADITKALALGLPDASLTAQAHELRAFTLMRLQDFAAAIADFSSVIAIRPATHLYYHRANLSRTIGNGAAALADYQKVIGDDKAPKAMVSQSYLGLAFIAHGGRDVVNAMTNYDSFFASLAGADDQTRALGAQIVQSLIKSGYYSGAAQAYDSEFRNALAECVKAPGCNP